MAFWIRPPGSYVLRYAVVLLLVSGCATAPDAVVEPWGRGDSRTSQILPYQKLRAKTAGWRIWEVADKNRLGCVAIKPADGTPWPRLSAIDGTVTGRGGFYMFTLASLDTPQFAFYGSLGSAAKTMAEAEGKTFADVNDRATVLGWEGLAVAFEVTTQPPIDLYGRPSQTPGTFQLREIGKAFGDEAPAPSSEAVVTEGVVDFTGVRAAFEEMMDCRRRSTGGY